MAKLERKRVASKSEGLDAHVPNEE